MTKPYDLIVIGTGTAAMTAAMRVRAAGWRVTVIDHRPFGGTCALRGCDPKKMLIGGADALDHARRMQGNGVTGDVRIDWQRLMAFKLDRDNYCGWWNDEPPARSGWWGSDWQAQVSRRSRPRAGGQNSVGAHSVDTGCSNPTAV